MLPIESSDGFIIRLICIECCPPTLQRNIRNQQSLTVFALKDFFDDLHSDEEDRFLLVGRSNNDRIMLISYTVRDEIIRIISARPLRKNEVKKYGYGQ